jgi:protein-disulfide isomerase
MTNLKQNKTLVVTALISSLISIVLHTQLALNHYKLIFGLGEGPSICNINSQFNCDAVAMSKYSTLFDLPIATWGAFTHFALSFLLGLYLLGFLQNPSRVLRVATWLSVFVAGVSIVMGSISATALGTYCLFCIATYVLSFIIAGCLIPSNDAPLLANLPQDLTALFRSQKWIIFVFILIPCAAFLSNSMYLDAYGMGELKIVIQESVENWKNNPVKPFTQEGFLTQNGNEEPKVTIVEFADFLCPHCRAASEPLHNFVLSHKGVRLIFKPFPLDGVCNDPKIPKRDGIRCELAYAAFCAEDLEKKGWPAQQYIFSHQEQWSPTSITVDIEKMADELGIKKDQLKECMQKSEIHQKVVDVAKEGSFIEGTPSIFLNGKELPRGSFAPVLSAAVQAL